MQSLLCLGLTLRCCPQWQQSWQHDLQPVHCRLRGLLCAAGNQRVLAAHMALQPRHNLDTAGQSGEGVARKSMIECYIPTSAFWGANTGLHEISTLGQQGTGQQPAAPRASGHFNPRLSSPPSP